MIRLSFSNGNGGYRIALVLEPDNVERIRKGECVIVSLNELIPALPFRLDLAFDYTPDAAWVAEEFQRRGIMTTDAFWKLLEEGQSRPEVKNRPGAGKEVLVGEKVHRA